MRHCDAARQLSEKPSALVVEDRRARCDRGGEKHAPDRRYQPAMESRRRGHAARDDAADQPRQRDFGGQPIVPRRRDRPWSRRPNCPAAGSAARSVRRPAASRRRQAPSTPYRSQASGRVHNPERGRWRCETRARAHPAGTGPVGYNRSEAAGAPTRNGVCSSERTILSHRSCR